MGHYEQFSSRGETKKEIHQIPSETSDHLKISFDDLKGKLGQVQTWLERIEQLQQAKELAYEHAKAALKAHTEAVMEDMKVHEAEILAEMKAAHCTQTQSLDQVQRELSDRMAQLQASMHKFSVDDSDFEQVKQVRSQLDNLVDTLSESVWCQRSVLRFIPHCPDLVLGSLQQCYLSEDYTQITKLRMHRVRQDSELDLRQAVLTANITQRRKRSASECSSSSTDSTLSLKSSTSVLSDSHQHVCEQQKDKCPHKRSSIGDLSRLSTEDRKQKKRNKIIRSLSNIIIRRGSFQALSGINKANSFSEPKYDTEAKTTQATVIEDNMALNTGVNSLITDSTPTLVCNIMTTSNTGTLYEAKDIQFLPDGDLLLSGESKVYRINPSVEATKQGVFGSDLKSSAGITLNKDGYVLICDLIQCNLKAYTRGGMLCSKFGTGYFHKPKAVAATSQDNYVVVDHRDTGQHCVYLYNPMTGSTLQLGTYILHSPHSVCVSTTDRIYISDSSQNAVYIFTCAGVYESQFGGNGQLCCPLGLCTDAHGHVYVADSGNNRVCVYTSQGQYIRDLVTATQGLQCPQALTVSTQAQLAVLQHKHILIFDMSSLLTPSTLTSTQTVV